MHEQPTSLEAHRARRRGQPDPEPEPYAGVLSAQDLRRSLAGVMEGLVECTIALDRLELEDAAQVRDELAAALVAAGRAASIARGTGALKRPGTLREAP